MFRTSKLQKIVKVPQVRDIDEVAKDIRRMWVPMIKDETQMVTRSMRRQVPTIQDETEGSEARGGADQFQSLPQEQDGHSRSADKSADKEPRLTKNNREGQPRR